MQQRNYGGQHLGQPPVFKKGDLVHEAGGEHKTPARVIEVIESHGHTYYRIHFKYKSILQKVILPEFRLIKYINQ